MKTVAVVPIKLNNERLPGKNFKLLGNQPLIQYILKQLKLVKEIEEIYVYCSSEEICEYLIEGATYLKRPTNLDLPTSNFNEIFDGFINTIVADRYVYAHATAPFIMAETIRECLKATENNLYDSAFTAVEIQDYLWDREGPLNFDAKNIPRSQDLEKIYRETSGVYIIKPDVYKKLGRRVGEIPYIKTVNFKEAIDINTFEDFKIAEAFINFEI